MQVAVSRMIASVASRIVGWFSRPSTRTSPGAYITTARTVLLLVYDLIEVTDMIESDQLVGSSLGNRQSSHKRPRPGRTC
jgi:hypothetical protein